MIGNIVVIVIIIVAVMYLGKVLLCTIKKGGCSCGGGSCSKNSSCQPKQGTEDKK